MTDTVQPALKRTINLPLLAFYGIGTILGAGIYVLVGKVAGVAGMYTPVAFLVASLLAGLSAFSYAELAVRFPRSAGEAIYIKEGLRRQWLAVTVGLLIVVVAITSTATLINGLVGYANAFIDVPAPVVIITTVLLLGLVVTWGIGESVMLAGIMTVIEILGLVVIIWVAREGFAMLPARVDELTPPGDMFAWSGILLGAFIAFYAFIGFEDMVNVAEEVKQPEKNLPRGIFIALAVTTVFYCLVSLLSIIVVTPAELASSDAPLAFLYNKMTKTDGNLIVWISMASIINGALVQMVMASRILYGMSSHRWIPAFFGVVHLTRRTPVNATIVVLALTLVFALLLPLLSLAKLTSFITLIIFSVINFALWRIKLRHEASPGLSISIWVPALGFGTSVVFLLYQLWSMIH